MATKKTKEEEEGAATIIQSIWRGYSQKHQYVSLRNGIIELQTMIRMKKQYRIYEKQIHAAMTIQLHSREWLQKKHNEVIFLVVLEYQKHYSQQLFSHTLIFAK